MPIDVSWGDENHHYVYIHVAGHWHWDEYHAKVKEANKLIHSVEHKLCIITHLTDSQAQALPTNAFKEWRKSVENPPANLQMVILVPGQPIIQAFTDIAYRLFSRFLTFRFCVAPTLEDAKRIAHEAHKQIPAK